MFLLLKNHPVQQRHISAPSGYFLKPSLGVTYFLEKLKVFVSLSLGFMSAILDGCILGVTD